MTRRGGLALLAVATWACAGGFVGGGYTSVRYELVDRRGAELVEARLWSSGALRETDGHAAWTRVPLVLELRPAQGVVLAPPELDYVTTWGGLGQGRRVRGPTAALSLAAGARRRVELVFHLPADVAPADLDAVRLRWTVSAGGRAWSGSTLFARFAEPIDALATPLYHTPGYTPFEALSPSGMGYRVTTARVAPTEVRDLPFSHRARF